MPAEALLRTYRELVERRLDELLPSVAIPPSRLHEAMRYSCLAPGKRIRPALCMASCKSVGGDPKSALDAAAGIEMIHVFSLIHDDLPAIDNDELRRGRATCHMEFGEAIAILAGDALFALGFEAVAGSEVDPDRVAKSIRALAAAAGSSGLVGGEVIDVESEGTEVHVSTLEMIHRQKTGALISASCRIGAIIGGASEEDVSALSEFGMLVGLAFQITDDVLNEISEPALLGKASGTDQLRGKATYPAAFGLSESRERATVLIDAAIDMFGITTIERSELELLARYAIDRIH